MRTWAWIFQGITSEGGSICTWNVLYMYMLHVSILRIRGVDLYYYYKTQDFFPLKCIQFHFFFCIQEIETQSSPRRFPNIFIFKVSNALHTRQIFSPVTYQIGIFGFQEMNSKYILYSLKCFICQAIIFQFPYNVDSYS